MDPRLVTAAVKLQYGGYLRREDINAAVLALDKAASRSKKSLDAPAIAAGRCGASCAASARRCSARASARLHEANGVTFCLGTAVEALEGHGRVQQLVLKDGGGAWRPAA